MTKSLQNSDLQPSQNIAQQSAPSLDDQPDEKSPTPAEDSVEAASSHLLSKSFEKLKSKLPKNIQDLAEKTIEVFKANPNYPSLHNERIYDSAKGSHIDGSWSIRVSLGYRALYVIDDDGTNVFYWIGTKSDFLKLTRSK